MRLDRYLVEHNYFSSRAKAQDAIRRGLVLVNQSVINKSGMEVKEGDTVELVAHDFYVSRAGEKLQFALRECGINLLDAVVLDIGCSTGGFIEVCLKAGAKYVYGVDVGSSQLDQSLRLDPRVTAFENTDARELNQGMFVMPITFFTMDVSFISCLKILLPLQKWLPKETPGLVLIKPQFEADQKALNKRGVIKNGRMNLQIAESVIAQMKASGIQIFKISQSFLPGKEGNLEFFAYISL